MSNKFDAVIFDLDGTLCDTLCDIHRSLNMMLAECGYPEITYEKAYDSINRGARNLVTNVLPESVATDDAEVTRCLDIYNGHYAQHYLDNIRLYDGIFDLCTKLKADGVKLAVLSNKPHVFVSEIVKKLLPDLFEVVMGQSDLPHKPDPTAPLYIADKLGVSPDRTVFCGDSNIDMTTGLNANMLPVGVSWGYRPAGVLLEAGADFIIDTPDELYEIMNDSDKFASDGLEAFLLKLLIEDHKESQKKTEDK